MVNITRNTNTLSFKDIDLTATFTEKKTYHIVYLDLPCPSNKRNRE